MGEVTDDRHGAGSDGMRLWLLAAKRDRGGYEETRTIVVRAITEESAREFAVTLDTTLELDDVGHLVASPYQFWRDDSASSCVELTAEGEPGVILYNAW